MLLLGPGTHYPDHSHRAEEVYHPLGGEALWKMGKGEFALRKPGECIYHPSTIRHAMQTQKESLLALFCWSGDTHTPAALQIGK
jgi:mannose-6-phosphate isomerase-like protein (cupin superfamily)